MLDLKPEYKTTILKILNEYLPDRTIWAYGSRVKGNAHEASDLDLAIMPANTNLSAKQLSALKSAFSESNLPILVDIVDWDTIPENFKNEIEQQHEILR